MSLPRGATQPPKALGWRAYVPTPQLDKLTALQPFVPALVRAAQCGRVPVRIICCCLHAPDINIPHLAEDGSECVREAEEAFDAEPSADVLQDSASDEEDSATSASEWEAASELTEELDSDYEAEEPMPQQPPLPEPEPRRAKRKFEA